MMQASPGRLSKKVCLFCSTSGRCKLKACQCQSITNCHICGIMQFCQSLMENAKTPNAKYKSAQSICINIFSATAESEDTNASMLNSLTLKTSRCTNHHRQARHAKARRRPLSISNEIAVTYTKTNYFFKRFSDSANVPKLEGLSRIPTCSHIPPTPWFQGNPLKSKSYESNSWKDSQRNIVELTQ